jgi:hypothetical protein
LTRTRERRERGERATSDQHRQNVTGILRRSPAHLLRMSCSPSRPWITDLTQEEERLEKACVARWKIAATGGRRPQREEHVSELAHGREYAITLDVELHERNGRRESR